MKTLKSKISTALNNISKKAFGNSATIRNLIKPMVVNLLNIITMGKGISVNIGSQGIFKMSPQFYFSNWENFGEGHNSGFKYCLEQAKNKKVVLDIGAHIGLYSMPLSRRMSSEGKIYSFEPSSVNRSYLKYHLKLNNIELSNSIPEEITNFDVYYLIPWTQNSEYEINSNVNFYATYETQSSEINDADCKIKIDSVNYNMAYDQASKSYIYTKSFETTEKKQYSITCDSFYTVESSIMVVDTSTPPIDPICGNDILEEPEECDDGNIISNDGCSFECKKEIINSDCTVDSDCDNSLYCDGTEICNNGVCKSGTPPIKNDNIDCTIDYCDEELNLIVNQADHSICQNGLWCDGTEICDINLGCQNGEIQTCNDNIECSVDSCNEGLNLSDNSGSCLFDNSNCDCNIDSDCNDNNECTNDLCGTNSKCVNNPLNQTTCDDNLFCTEKDMCIEGICTGTK